MRIDLLPEGNIYKANLHCHTKETDSGSGFSTPAQIKDLYKAHGYNIIAYTGHNKLTYREELNDDEFLALPGFEAMMTDPETERIFHFNCYPKYPDTQADYAPLKLDFSLDNINKMIQTYTEKDYLVMYNHPAASFHSSPCQETQEYLGLQGIFAVEIYNHIVETLNRTGWSDTYYDLMLRNGRRLWAVASDDNHSGWPEPVDSPPDTPYSRYMGGFVMIVAKGLNQTCVVDALQNGNFYSCVGKKGIAPQIYRMYVEDNIFYADFSPVKSVYLKNSYWHCPHKLSFHDDITHVEFTLDSTWTYVRLEITDSNGYRALGNPYFLK